VTDMPQTGSLAVAVVGSGGRAVGWLMQGIV
jgi:hypothetical protein